MAVLRDCSLTLARCRVNERKTVCVCTRSLVHYCHRVPTISFAPLRTAHGTPEHCGCCCSQSRCGQFAGGGLCRQGVCFHCHAPTLRLPAALGVMLCLYHPSGLTGSGLPVHTATDKGSVPGQSRTYRLLFDTAILQNSKAYADETAASFQQHFLGFCDRRNGCTAKRVQLQQLYCADGEGVPTTCSIRNQRCAANSAGGLWIALLDALCRHTAATW